MNITRLLEGHLRKVCPNIHSSRLQALMDVASALQKSNNLSLTVTARCMEGPSRVKHKIKKVDRLEGNQHLHKELHTLYTGLSSYVFLCLSKVAHVPVIIDLCFVKDDRAIQMLSAEISAKGRSIPVYREVFESGGLKKRAHSFINNLTKCLPAKRPVILIMDAGFSESWFKAAESHNFSWLVRVRQGRSVKLTPEDDWQAVKAFLPKIQARTKVYKEASLMKSHQRPCRIITTRKSPKKPRKITTKSLKARKIGSGAYHRSAKEPWVLATNLPAEYSASEVIKYYAQRMQIEESFRDMKSHQFGLSGRYIRTECIHRWAVKMLLAAIVQIIYWVLGIIGHRQGMQKYFQPNTVKDRKVFSYFTLGRLILMFDKLDELKINPKHLPSIIQEELALSC